jgi:hypothetical protein
MFTSVAHTKQITGKDVDLALLNRAQSIIEIFVGKVEASIEDGNDLQLLAKATAYQAAYMQENESIIYEQVALRSSGQGESIVSFADMTSPFIAPLAVMALNSLSFKRSRSVQTGKMFQISDKYLAKYLWRRI